MMFDLYPDILTVIPPRDATTDPSGDYDPAPAQETEYAICRAVRNGSGQVVRLQGGTEYRFSYVLYLPAGTPALKLGTPVRVYSRQGNERVASGCGADFVSGPRGCKLWI